MDSYIATSNIGILTSLKAENSTSLLLQNVFFENVPVAVKDNSTTAPLLNGGTKLLVPGWGFGMVGNSTGYSSFYNGRAIPQMNRSASLTTNVTDGRGPIFLRRKKPSYTDIGLTQIIDVKANGAAGDGVHDDTAVLNSIFARAANLSSIVFMPFGVYLITDTLEIPLGTRLVGQAWAQFMLTGPKFQNVDKPHVGVRVGHPGDVGVIEIQDVMFTVKGPTAGAVLVEWNVKESAQGSAAMWGLYSSLSLLISTTSIYLFRRLYYTIQR
jgi:hypothetical protein